MLCILQPSLNQPFAWRGLIQLLELSFKRRNASAAHAGKLVYGEVLGKVGFHNLSHRGSAIVFHAIDVGKQLYISGVG